MTMTVRIPVWHVSPPGAGPISGEVQRELCGKHQGRGVLLPLWCRSGVPGELCTCRDKEIFWPVPVFSGVGQREFASPRNKVSPLKASLSTEIIKALLCVNHHC